MIRARWERQHASQSMAIKHESSSRQFSHRNFLKVVVKESLDPLIGRTEIVGEQAVALLLPREQQSRHSLQLAFPTCLHEWQAHRRQLKIDVATQLRFEKVRRSSSQSNTFIIGSRECRGKSR